MSKQSWSEKRKISGLSAKAELEIELRKARLLLPSSGIGWPSGQSEVTIDRLEALTRALHNIAVTSFRFARAQTFPPPRQRATTLGRLALKVAALHREVANYEWLRTIRASPGDRELEELSALRIALERSAAAIRQSTSRSAVPGRIREKRSDLAMKLFIRNMITVWRVIFERDDIEKKEFRTFVIAAGRLCGRFTSEAAVRDRILRYRGERQADLAARPDRLERILELERLQIQYAFPDSAIVDV